jgi:hypothetical protein
MGALFVKRDSIFRRVTSITEQFSDFRFLMDRNSSGCSVSNEVHVSQNASGPLSVIVS